MAAIVGVDVGPADGPGAARLDDAARLHGGAVAPIDRRGMGVRGAEIREGHEVEEERRAFDGAAVLPDQHRRRRVLDGDDERIGGGGAVVVRERHLHGIRAALRVRVAAGRRSGLPGERAGRTERALGHGARRHAPVAPLDGGRVGVERSGVGKIPAEGYRLSFAARAIRSGVEHRGDVTDVQRERVGAARAVVVGDRDGDGVCAVVGVDVAARDHPRSVRFGDHARLGRRPVAPGDGRGMCVVRAGIAERPGDRDERALAARLVGSGLDRRRRVVHGHGHFAHRRREPALGVGHRQAQHVGAVVERREAEALRGAARDHLSVGRRRLPREGVGRGPTTERIGDHGHDRHQLTLGCDTVTTEVDGRDCEPAEVERIDLARGVEGRELHADESGRGQLAIRGRRPPLGRNLDDPERSILSLRQLQGAEPERAGHGGVHERAVARRAVAEEDRLRLQRLRAGHEVERLTAAGRGGREAQPVTRGRGIHLSADASARQQRIEIAGEGGDSCVVAGERRRHRQRLRRPAVYGQVQARRDVGHDLRVGGTGDLLVADLPVRGQRIDAGEKRFETLGRLSRNEAERLVGEDDARERPLLGRTVRDEDGLGLGLDGPRGNDLDEFSQEEAAAADHLPRDHAGRRIEDRLHRRPAKLGVDQADELLAGRERPRGRTGDRQREHALLTIPGLHEQVDLRVVLGDDLVRILGVRGRRRQAAVRGSGLQRGQDGRLERHRGDERHVMERVIAVQVRESRRLALAGHQDLERAAGIEGAQVQAPLRVEDDVVRGGAQGSEDRGAGQCRIRGVELNDRAVRIHDREATGRGRREPGSGAEPGGARRQEERSAAAGSRQGRARRPIQTDDAAQRAVEQIDVPVRTDRDVGRLIEDTGLAIHDKRAGHQLVLHGVVAHDLDLRGGGIEVHDVEDLTAEPGRHHPEVREQRPVVARPRLRDEGARIAVVATHVAVEVRRHVQGAIGAERDRPRSPRFLVADWRERHKLPRHRVEAKNDVALRVAGVQRSLAVQGQVPGVGVGEEASPRPRLGREPRRGRRRVQRRLQESVAVDVEEDRDVLARIFPGVADAVAVQVEEERSEDRVGAERIVERHRAGAPAAIVRRPGPVRCRHGDPRAPRIRAHRRDEQIRAGERDQNVWIVTRRRQCGPIEVGIAHPEVDRRPEARRGILRRRGQPVEGSARETVRRRIRHRGAAEEIVETIVEHEARLVAREATVLVREDGGIGPRDIPDAHVGHATGEVPRRSGQIRIRQSAQRIVQIRAELER